MNALVSRHNSIYARGIVLTNLGADLELDETSAFAWEGSMVFFNPSMG